MTTPATKKGILAAHEFYADTPRAERFDPKHQWAKKHRRNEHHILHFPQDQLRHFLRWRPDARRGKECRVGNEAFPTVFMVDIANQIGFQNVEDAYQALKRFVKTNAWFPDRRERRWLIEYASIFPVSDTPDDASRFVMQLDAGNEPGVGKRPSAASTIAAWDREREYENLTPQLMFALTDDPDWQRRSPTRYRDTKHETVSAGALRFASAALRILDECTHREHGTTFARHVLGKATMTRIPNPLGDIATIDIRKSPRRITTYPAKRVATYRRLVRNAYSLTAHPIDEGWGWHPHAPEPDTDLPQGAVKRLQEAGHAIHTDVHARRRETAPTRAGTILEKRAPTTKRAAKRMRAPTPRPTAAAPTRPQVRVTVNSERLEELETRSATLRERLVPDEHLRPDESPSEPAPTHAATQPGDGLDGASASDPLLAVEDAEYLVLLRSLTRHEHRAVTALLTDVDASLVEIAQAADMPATLLIDQVNEKALEALGDTLIDTARATPVMFEEHAEALTPLEHAHR